jgi:crotonobetainyl-CoA:carnitine CoA-transferase CaiB-like acyl-CoA transferase
VARGRERGDAGGFATVRALADLHVVEVGADVVKVEPPHGDPLR